MQNTIEIPELLVPSAVIRSELEMIRLRPGVPDKNYGVVCRKVITNEFVNLIVSAMLEDSSTNLLAGFQWHLVGNGWVDGTNDPSVGDTYDTFTPVKWSSEGQIGRGTLSNVFQSVATVSFTADGSFNEHGVFNAATAAALLLDRSTFESKAVRSGDQFQFIYRFTITAGN